MPTIAETCFEEIIGQADPFAYLYGLVKAAPDPPTFEEEWLDFKGEPRDDANTLKIWREAISGYANTGGGVLVWGLDARKDSNGVDVVQAHRLIANPNKMKGDLLGAVGTATDPPMNGFRVEAFPGPNNGPGFVVCFVPEGTEKPYRAETSGERSYWMRAGTSFIQMPRAILKTLFYPKASADLRLLLECKYFAATHFEKNLRVNFQLSIENKGNASAENIFIRYILTPNFEEDTTTVRFILHPSMKIDVCVLEVPMESAMGQPGEPIYPRGIAGFDFFVYAKDMEPRRFKCKIGDRQIRFDKGPKYVEMVPFDAED